MLNDMATQTMKSPTAIIAVDPSAHARSMSAKELGEFIAAECKELCIKLASLKPYVEVAFERLDAGEAICGYTSKPTFCECVLGRTYNAVKFMLAGGNPRNVEQNNNHNFSNHYTQGNPRDGKHYWLTPPDLLERIRQEFGELNDPCRYPRPEGFDGLTSDWSDVNYVNPPFGSTIENNKKMGMTAWVRKAIAEQKKGKTTILVYPQDGWVHMLIEAGVEMRSLGRVMWQATEDPTCEAAASRPIMMFILRGKHE